MRLLLKKRNGVPRRIVRITMAAIVDDEFNRGVGRVDSPGRLHRTFLVFEIHDRIVAAGDV